MTTDETAGFEPVLLNLSGSGDYATLVNALEEWASKMDAEADNEAERVRYNKLPDAGSDEAHWRGEATRARNLLDAIDRQLDANGVARRAVQDGA